MDGETLFNHISDKFCLDESDVHLGKMMSSPGLQYKGKVFAFYFRDRMGFRLGSDFDMKKFRLKSVEPLNPFKTKPPLKGWYVVTQDEKAKWERLTDMALQFTRTLAK